MDMRTEIPVNGKMARRWHVGTLSYSTGALVVLFFFLLLGDLAWSLKERSVQEVFKVILRKFSQNALLLNALVGALPAIVTMVVGPIVGSWSDRTRTRLGRRIPFLLATSPIVGVSIASMAFSEPIADFVMLLGLPAESRPTVVLVCLVVSWTIFEVSTIIGNALFVALINDTVPRVVLGRFFGTFRMISLSVGATFFYFLFDNNLINIVRPLMIGIALIYVGGFGLLCWQVKEGSYPAPVTAAPSGANRLGSYIRNSTSVRFFTLLFVVVAFATVSFLPVNINSFNASEQFGVDRAGYAKVIALTYLCSICIAFPIGWLADRFHPLGVGIVALTLYSISMLSGWVCVDDARTFSLFLLIHGIGAGVFLTCTASLLPKLLPADRFSELAAASAALTALMTVCLTLSVGALVDWAGRDFRLIFLASGVVSGLAVMGWIWLLRDFKRLGGVHNYVVPKK